MDVVPNAFSAIRVACPCPLAHSEITTVTHSSLENTGINNGPEPSPKESTAPDEPPPDETFPYSLLNTRSHNFAVFDIPRGSAVNNARSKNPGTAWAGGGSDTVVVPGAHPTNSDALTIGTRDAHSTCSTILPSAQAGCCATPTLEPLQDGSVPKKWYKILLVGNCEFEDLAHTPSSRCSTSGSRQRVEWGKTLHFRCDRSPTIRFPNENPSVATRREVGGHTDAPVPMLYKSDTQSTSGSSPVPVPT